VQFGRLPLDNRNAQARGEILMTIAELHPVFVSEQGRNGQGLIFDCSHCLKQRFIIYFANPLDGGLPMFTACISGQAEPRQPEPKLPAQQAAISPTMHGHASSDARYQTDSSLSRACIQEVDLCCLRVKEINVKAITFGFHI
jgi:hypothetical protein